MKRETIKKFRDIIITLLFILIISLMTIGYAVYGEILHLNGFVTVQAYVNNVIEITNITYVSGTNINSHGTPTYDDLTATFPNNSFNVTSSTKGTAIYTAEVTNDTASNYVYEGNTFTPNTSSGSGWFQTNNFTVNIDGIQVGDEIAPGETIIITVTFTASSSSSTTITASPVVLFNFSNDNSGSLLASLSTTNVNLRNNDMVGVQFSLINTYAYMRLFNVESSNSNFSFVDSNGDALGELSVPNGTSLYTVYIKENDGASFLSDTANTSLIITSNGIANITAGSIEVLVEEDLMVTDTLAPQIGPVTISQATSNGKINISWSRTDVGGTNITGYTIIIYNSSDTVIETINTSNALTSYTTGSSNQLLPAGTYYAIVYGTDLAGNTGSGGVSTASLDTTDCRKSPSVAMQWIYNVDSSGVSSLTFTGESTIAKGNNYMATLTATSGSLPSSITISMGGTNLGTDSSATSYYTYNTSSGAIVVYNVQGDLVITATGSCFVKGTLITLADGTKKKIEDIDYTDLLLVWDYEHGIFTYEYPIWIEKEGKSESYQLTTFSDGSVLKTVNYHGIFSLDDMKFVSVDDRQNFNIGTRVVKTVYDDNQYKFQEVTVENIEIIYEEVNYYQVVTSIYYNVMGNDYMTTDGNIMLVNMYGFNNDLTWKVDRNQVISNTNNLFDYEMLSSVMPYYMFKGLRASEVKYIANLGYFSLNDVPLFMKKLESINTKLLLEVPLDKDGKRRWMVTTSDDNITDKDEFLVVEGTYYTLMAPNNYDDTFIGWYNTSDGKIYNVLDEVQIWHGTHFIAIYE